jgi:hypothetical protein
VTNGLNPARKKSEKDLKKSPRNRRQNRQASCVGLTGTAAGAPSSAMEAAVIPERCLGVVMPVYNEG